MPLHPAVRELAIYMKNHPEVRSQVRAQPGKTLLYTGRWFADSWKEIADAKRNDPQVADKQILPDVLRTIAVPGTPHATLFAWLDSIDKLHPWQEIGFRAWRLASGLFASNAIGEVSFWLGAWKAGEKKIFALVELPVLRRNPNLGPVTQELLEYYDRCVKAHAKGDLVLAGFLAQ